MASSGTRPSHARSKTPCGSGERTRLSSTIATSTKGIVAIGRFPVDQPETFAVEQDVARDGIVMAGDKTSQTCIIGLVEPLKTRDVRIKNAGGKKTGSAHMREQARDDVRIVDEGGEDRRGLDARQQLSQRLCQRVRAARIGAQRSLRDEVD